MLEKHMSAVVPYPPGGASASASRRTLGAAAATTGPGSVAGLLAGVGNGHGVSNIGDKGGGKAEIRGATGGTNHVGGSTKPFTGSISVPGSARGGGSKYGTSITGGLTGGRNGYWAGVHGGDTGGGDESGGVISIGKGASGRANVSRGVIGEVSLSEQPGIGSLVICRQASIAGESENALGFGIGGGCYLWGSGGREYLALNVSRGILNCPPEPW